MFSPSIQNDQWLLQFEFLQCGVNQTHFMCFQRGTSFSNFFGVVWTIPEELHITNRPCYSCLLSVLAFEWQRGWRWTSFNKDLCCCCVNQVVLMLTRCIYMTKAERSVSKQGQLQPRCHLKNRSPCNELWNGLLSKLVNQGMRGLDVTQISHNVN